MSTVLDLTSAELESEVFRVINDVQDRIEKAGLSDLFRTDFLEVVDMCEVGVNRRLRTSGGRMIEKRHSSFVDKKSKFIEVKIEFHKELKLESLDKIAEHEALHLLTGLHDGERFNWLCDRLGIIKKHEENFNTIKDFKYKVFCSECEQVLAKRRIKSKPVKKPELYRSSCCGAELRSEKI